MEDVLRYAMLVNLSEAQCESMKHSYADYYKRVEEMQQEQLPPLYTLAVNVCRLETASIEYAKGLEDMFAKRQRFVEKLKKIDVEFFDNVALILSDDQLALMPNVELDRDRTSLQIAFGSSAFTESRIDVIRLVERVVVDTEEQAKLCDLYIEYLQTIVPILRRKAETYLTMLPKDAFVLAAMYSTAQQNQAPATPSAIFAERRHQLFAQQVALSRRIRSINRDFAQRFIDKLGGEAGEKLRELFKTMAFPGIYPDERYPGTLLASIAGDQGLDDGQKEVIAILRSDFESAHRSVSEKLERLEVDWQAKIGATASYHVNDLDEFEKSRDALVTKRNALDESIVHQMMDVLTPDQQERYKPRSVTK